MVAFFKEIEAATSVVDPDRVAVARYETKGRRHVQHAAGEQRRYTSTCQRRKNGAIVEVVDERKWL